ncbi:unnamed protein product [Cyprideis torosa]|uniref:Uncharacterized protein n=1 Tax=Cyprideis torosa TaxID=163714 RepID=A0A7R8WHC9_9CRUS|nr:unnamed protein product [Cyprideis torosa]CAG0893692.1 unnamed protein product [Cyprideis torosa]
MAPSVIMCVVLCFGSVLLPSVTGANIWMIMTLGSRSHKNVFDPLIGELGARGHNVTFFNPFPGRGPRKGVKEIIFPRGNELALQLGADMWRQEGKASGTGGLLKSLIYACKESCKAFFEWDEFQPYYKGLKGKPDLILLTLFNQPCLLAIPHKLDVPFAFISPHGLFPSNYRSIGLRPSPSFMPHPVGFIDTDRMSFTERASNTLMWHILTFAFDWYSGSWMDAFLTEQNGGQPLTAHEVMKEASLFITNMAPAFDFPAPSLPVIVHAGGMHCRPPQPVAQEFEDWIKKGKKGFIYFSLGSAVKGTDMPEEFRGMFLNAFKKFPEYQIFWKWETEQMDGVPPNVKLSKWMPQQDLLGHKDIRLFITHGGLLSTQEATYHGVPVVGIAIGADQMLNMKKTEKGGAGLALEWGSLTEEKLVNSIKRHKDIRLFITHGGLLSTQEATYHGVPVVGIAIGADQMLNMKKTEKDGAGLALEWGSLTEENLVHSIKRVLEEPSKFDVVDSSFRENLARRSAIMKDQPETPLERAVFWTEYVIRHKGAPHLRSAARDLTWYQYHSVDVWGFLISCLVLIILLELWILRTCFRLMCKSGGNSGAKKSQSKKKKSE